MASPIRPPQFNPLRELAGLVRGAASLPALVLDAPRGTSTGSPVMVLPGYLAGDGSTLALRTYLARRGHLVIGWELGRNLGDVRALVGRVIERVQRHRATGGVPIHLVGWSLGGVIARETAREIPEAVAQVITIGSPVVGGPKYTVVARSSRRRGMDLDGIEREIAKREEVALRVPVTALYSKRDGVVAWRACIDPNPANRVEHIEVDATHIALPWDAAVLRHVASRIEALAAAFPRT